MIIDFKNGLFLSLKTFAYTLSDSTSIPQLSFLIFGSLKQENYLTNLLLLNLLTLVHFSHLYCKDLYGSCVA